MVAEKVKVIVAFVDQPRLGRVPSGRPKPSIAVPRPAPRRRPLCFGTSPRSRPRSAPFEPLKSNTERIRSSECYDNLAQISIAVDNPLETRVRRRNAEARRRAPRWSPLMTAVITGRADCYRGSDAADLAGFCRLEPSIPNRATEHGSFLVYRPRRPDPGEPVLVMIDPHRRERSLGEIEDFVAVRRALAGQGVLFG